MPIEWDCCAGSAHGGGNRGDDSLEQKSEANRKTRHLSGDKCIKPVIWETNEACRVSTHTVRIQISKPLRIEEAYGSCDVRNDIQQSIALP